MLLELTSIYRNGTQNKKPSGERPNGLKRDSPNVTDEENPADVLHRSSVVVNRANVGRRFLVVANQADAQLHSSAMLERLQNSSP
jgi:hypothetical protein